MPAITLLSRRLPSLGGPVTAAMLLAAPQAGCDAEPDYHYADSADGPPIELLAGIPQTWEVTVNTRNYELMGTAGPVFSVQASVVHGGGGAIAITLDGAIDTVDTATPELTLFPSATPDCHLTPCAAVFDLDFAADEDASLTWSVSAEVSDGSRDHDELPMDEVELSIQFEQLQEEWQ